MPDPRRYSIFLSYRHADNRQQDQRWADWLHRALERYEIPPDLIGKINQRGEPIPSTLYPVFRDEEELSADAELSQPIRRALENSANLIVLCSPQACASHYVADELRTFKELGKSDRIFALILEGEPNASDPAQECFPELLRHGAPNAAGQIEWATVTEPIAADVRPEGTSGPGRTTALAWRKILETQGVSPREAEERATTYEHRLHLAQLKLISAVLAIPLGELSQRDQAFQIEKERRRARLFRRVAAAFVFLGLLAGAAAVVAWWQREEAVRAREAQTEALAGAYYDRALGYIAEDKLPEALPYVAASLRVQPQSPLASRLAAALLLDPRLRLPTTSPVERSRFWGTVFTPDRRRALINWMDQPPEWVDLATGRSAGRLEMTRSHGMTSSASFASDGSCAVIDGVFLHHWKGAQVGQPGSDQLHDLGMALGRILLTSTGETAVFSMPDNAAAEILGNMMGQSLDPSGDLKLIHLGTGQVETFDAHEGRIREVAAIPGTNEFLSFGEDRKLKHWSGSSMVAEYELPQDGKALSVSPRGTWAAIGGENDFLQLVELKTRKVRSLPVNSATLEVRDLAFSPDEQRLAVGFSEAKTSNGWIRVWDTATGRSLSHLRKCADWVDHLTYDAAGTRIAYLCSEGKAGLLEASTLQEIGTWFAGAQGNGIAMAAGDRSVVTALDERSLRLFSTEPAVPPLLRIALPLSVRRLALDERGEWALVALGPKRDRHAWVSLRDAAIQGKPIEHPERSIARVHIAQHDGNRTAVLFFEDGGFEVWDAEGNVVRQQAAPGSLLDVFAQLDSDLKGAISINMGGADALLFDPVEGCVLQALPYMQIEVLREITKKMQSGEVPADKVNEVFREQVDKIYSGRFEALALQPGPPRWSVTAKTGLQRPRISAGGHVIAASDTAKGGTLVWRRRQTGSPYEAVALPPEQTAPGAPPIRAVLDIALSRDGRWCLEIGGETRVCDLSASPPVWKKIAPGTIAVTAEFSPVAPLVALEYRTNDYSGTVQIWNVETGEPVSPKLTHDDTINVMRFSPDGSLLLTASDDNEVRVWDVASGRLAMPPFTSTADLNAAEFLPGGQGLVFGGEDRKLTIAPLPPTQPAPDWVPRILEGLGGARINEQGNAEPVSLAAAYDQTETAPGEGFWAELQRWLRRDPAQTLPVIGKDLPQLVLHHAENAWSAGKGRDAQMLLREALRLQPQLTIPKTLEPLARFLREPGTESKVVAEPGRPAGEVMEGPAGIRFRWCPPGRFVMGSPADEPNREAMETPHLVTLTRGFWMSETEITQEQWESVTGQAALDFAIEKMSNQKETFPFGNNGARVTVQQWHGLKTPEELRNWPMWFAPSLPMVLVSAMDAEAFAGRITKLLADDPTFPLPGRWKAALPTEAQWEYACRAGTSDPAYQGGSTSAGQHHWPELSKIAWYRGNGCTDFSGHGWIAKNWPEKEVEGEIAGVHPVRQKAPNAWGLHDLLGNVSEWCADGWIDELVDGDVDPINLNAQAYRSNRGGAVQSPIAHLRAAQRLRDPANWRSLGMGLRIILQEER